MKMIITLEDISIWKLLFMLAFFALLIFVLVRTAPSAELQYERSLLLPSYQGSFCLR